MRYYQILSKNVGFIIKSLSHLYNNTPLLQRPNKYYYKWDKKNLEKQKVKTIKKLFNILFNNLLFNVINHCILFFFLTRHNLKN